MRAISSECIGHSFDPFPRAVYLTQFDLEFGSLV
jgi:hypothetical protein